MGSTLIWALLIFVLVGFIYKKPIDNILSNFSRKGKIKYNGLNIDLGGDVEIQSDQVGQVNQKHVELKKAFQNAIITSEERFIRERLVDAKLSGDEAIDLLINDLAGTRLNLEMLVINTFIYEEQKEILYFLNIQSGPCPEVNLTPFFQKWYAKKSENQKYSFQQFFHFLLQKNLVTQLIGGYVILPLGKEYLSFLIRIGFPMPDLANTHFNEEENKSDQQ